MSVHRKLVVALLMLGAGMASAQAAQVHVSVFNGGAFGIDGSGTANTPTTPTMQPFVLAGTVNAGDVVTLTATGSISLSGPSTPIGPDGVMINLPPHSTVLGNLFGAVVYTLVPTATALNPIFQAFDALDVPLGISAGQVFLAGSSTTFTAASSGQIWLGVADSSFFDNTGPGFDVSLSVAPVPLPAPLAMLAAGLLGLGAIRRRRA